MLESEQRGKIFGAGKNFSSFPTLHTQQLHLAAAKFGAGKFCRFKEQKSQEAKISLVHLPP
jgi:hypothetical protein